MTSTTMMRTLRPIRMSRTSIVPMAHLYLLSLLAADVAPVDRGVALVVLVAIAVRAAVAVVADAVPVAQAVRPRVAAVETARFGPCFRMSRREA